MSDVPWQVRLSPTALSVLDTLPEHARETVRDTMSIAARDPWGFPAFDSRDPEGEDVRSAAAGKLTTVYWINRPASRLYVLDIVWLGN